MLNDTVKKINSAIIWNNYDMVDELIDGTDHIASEEECLSTIESLMDRYGYAENDTPVIELFIIAQEMKHETITKYINYVHCYMFPVISDFEYVKCGLYGVYTNNIKSFVQILKLSKLVSDIESDSDSDVVSTTLMADMITNMVTQTRSGDDNTYIRKEYVYYTDDNGVITNNDKVTEILKLANVVDIDTPLYDTYELFEYRRNKELYVNISWYVEEILTSSLNINSIIMFSFGSEYINNKMYIMRKVMIGENIVIVFDIYGNSMKNIDMVTSLSKEIVFKHIGGYLDGGYVYKADDKIKSYIRTIKYTIDNNGRIVLDLDPIGDVSSLGFTGYTF